MNSLDFPSDENVLVGKGTADDAGVYKVNEEVALIQTVDFFTPVVDDPYDFGRIAAANALSDVYAMGGKPKTAMNLVAFPIQTMSLFTLKAILAGGVAKIREAGAVLLGGHSVEDEELKYGLSVTGYVHPDKIWKNQGLRDGDCLILTKAVGTGILNTAIKAGLASSEEIKLATETMAMLNKVAASVIGRFAISACTDVTGFGLLGHLSEMIDGSGRSVHLESSTVPVLSGTYDYAAMGLVPVGAHRNRDYRKKMIDGLDDFDPVMRDILFDPQTSGGLLCGCTEKDSSEMIKQLHDAGLSDAAVIGRVSIGEKSRIVLQ